jgi:hypothetical protein
MATANITSDLQAQQPTGTTSLLVSLASLDHGALEQTLAHLAEALPGRDLVVASPDAAITGNVSSLRVVSYTPSAPSNASWTLTSADFLNTHELARQYQARAVLILGPEAQSLDPRAIRALAAGVLDENCDLTSPRYALPPRVGLVNTAILHPISRALFGARPRFPLAVDLGLSGRALERLAAAAQRFTAANQPDALIWPVAEISLASYSITEVEGGERNVPQPAAQDLNSLLASVAGSLFADIEAKAAFWQRARQVPPSRLSPHTPSAGEPVSPEEVAPMIDSFRLAYGNLQEIWSLVLPPQSLFGLKRLSVLPAANFVLPDSLWARVVYDFVLAYRLRTINRGHLLGALTPLYLAWVASHLLQTGSGLDPERHAEAVAAAFEADKPYLVSRWRWPDRFNP